MVTLGDNGFRPRREAAPWTAQDAPPLRLTVAENLTPPTGSSVSVPGRSALSTAVHLTQHGVMTSSVLSSVLSSSQTIRPRAVQSNPARTEVVVGLVNDGSARRVALAGLQHALAHGMSVSFVNVVSAGAKRQGAEDLGDTAFAAALDAMRGHGRVRCAFEVIPGDPERVLVARSRTAGLLVIGSDTSTPRASIAGYCRLHAGCTVLTVDVNGAGRHTPSITR